MTLPSHDLHQLRALISAVSEFVAAPSHLDFDQLALEVVQFQGRHLPGYEQLCRARGQQPAQLQRWQEAPAIPTSAFQRGRLTMLPAERIFRSSGTSVGLHQRSAHHHANLDLYRAIVDRTFPPAVLGSPAKTTDRRPMLSLIPSSALVPESSLSFMTDWVLRQYADASSRVSFHDGKLDAEGGLRWLYSRERSGSRPVMLTTALALWTLLDQAEENAVNDKDSDSSWPSDLTIMETGGFKTQRFSITRDQLLDRLARLTGIGEDRLVREYGMTELSSQAYSQPQDATDPDLFTLPPWTRVRTLDPLTMQEVRACPGSSELGLLAFLDLGNVASAASIVTEDLGQAAADGQHFKLLGRASDAQLRGCSLTTEELVSDAS